DVRYAASYNADRISIASPSNYFDSTMPRYSDTIPTQWIRPRTLPSPSRSPYQAVAVPTASPPAFMRNKHRSPISSRRSPNSRPNRSSASVSVLNSSTRVSIFAHNCSSPGSNSLKLYPAGSSCFGMSFKFFLIICSLMCCILVSLPIVSVNHIINMYKPFEIQFSLYHNSYIQFSLSHNSYIQCEVIQIPIRNMLHIHTLEETLTIKSGRSSNVYSYTKTNHQVFIAAG